MAFLMRSKSTHDAGRRTGDNASPQGAGFLASMDRRKEARCRVGRGQPMSAQLIGGLDVKLRNVSTRGVMFESSMRLLAGARVTLLLRTASRTLTLPGDVVRCSVSATRHGRLRYETALALASDCPLNNDELLLSPSTEVVSIVDGDVVDAEAVELVTIANEW
jgi:hypothetical protein